MRTDGTSTVPERVASPVRAFYEVGPVCECLTHQEAADLSRCETLIHKGWDSFVEVGFALTEIRDQRLYRASYKSFDAYCREKWDYKRAHAYRLIAAAQVVKCLSPIGDIQQPTHESQVRPLIGLEPEKVREAWKQAVAKARGERVRGTIVEEVVTRFKSDGVASKQCKPTLRNRGVQRSIEFALQCLMRVEHSIQRGDKPSATLRLLARAVKCLQSSRTS